MKNNPYLSCRICVDLSIFRNFSQRVARFFNFQEMPVFSALFSVWIWEDSVVHLYEKYSIPSSES